MLGTVLLLLLSLTANLHLDFVWTRSIDPADDPKTAATSAPCPPPPEIENAQPFNEKQIFQEGCELWYACKNGYLRKAGSYSRFRCVRENGTLKWDHRAFSCIPVQKNTTEIPHTRCPEVKPAGPSSTVGTKTTQSSALYITSGQDTFVQNVDFPYATIGTWSAVGLIICLAVVGATLWQQRQRSKKRQGRHGGVCNSEAKPTSPAELSKLKEDK